MTINGWDDAVGVGRYTSPMITPILMLGAGRMGGAILDGWRKTGAFAPEDLMIVDPHPGEAALEAADAGGLLNPPDADLARARTVLLCVKPQNWSEAAALQLKEASKLARSTLIGAAALLAESGADPVELRRQVTSPGGTTEAALNVLLGENGLPPLLREAVNRAMRRSKELGG